MLFKGKFCINRYIFNTDDLNQPKLNASELRKCSIHSHALCVGVNVTLTVCLQEGRMILADEDTGASRSSCSLCRRRAGSAFPTGTSVCELFWDLNTENAVTDCWWFCHSWFPNGNVGLGSKWHFLSAAVDISYAEVCKYRNPGAPWSPENIQNYLLVCDN